MEIIKAETRNPAEKAKQLRRSGVIPCVIFGAGMEESLPIQLDQYAARKLRQTKRSGSKADIQVDGKIYHTLIKEINYNAVSDAVVHICFHVLELDKKVNSVADVVLTHKDKVPGVLEQLQMRVPHCALPEDLIDTVTVDLEGLSIGTVLTVGDIPEFQSSKIELQTDSGNIVLRISDKKRSSAAAVQVKQEDTQ